MKKRTLLVVLTAFTCSFGLFAQVKKTEADKSSEKIKDAYKTTFEKNGFGDNWVISFGAGGQFLEASNNTKAYFKDRITLAPTFSVAKYFTPIWGLRLQLTGGTLHGFNDGAYGSYKKWDHGSAHYLGAGYAGTPGYPAQAGPNFLTWDPSWNYRGFSMNNADATKNILQNADGSYEWAGHKMGLLYMGSTNYVDANLNFMLNLMTLFGSYNPKRVFELTPYAGIGWYHAFASQGNDVFNAAGVNAGADAKVRISDRVGAFAELSGSLVPNGFDGQQGGRMNFEAIGQFTGGLSFYLGRTKWKVSEPMNYKLIDDLNQQINDLKAELNKPRPVCPPCPTPAPVAPIKEAAPQIKFLPDAVFFRINKSIVDATELAKIKKAATYLNNHPELNVVVTGYADKRTASAAYNLKLSEHRSKAVAQLLTNKYGISSSRVSVDWSGDQVQPFKVNDWNRVVIFVLKDK